MSFFCGLCFFPTFIVLSVLRISQKSWGNSFFFSQKGCVYLEKNLTQKRRPFFSLFFWAAHCRWGLFRPLSPPSPHPPRSNRRMSTRGGKREVLYVVGLFSVSPPSFLEGPSVGPRTPAHSDARTISESLSRADKYYKHHLLQAAKRAREICSQAGPDIYKRDHASTN